MAKSKDCPEEKIINKMPKVGLMETPQTPNEYYIYKGERKKSRNLMPAWIGENLPEYKSTRSLLS